MRHAWILLLAACSSTHHATPAEDAGDALELPIEAGVDADDAADAAPEDHTVACTPPAKDSNGNLQCGRALQDYAGRSQAELANVRTFCEPAGTVETPLAVNDGIVVVGCCDCVNGSIRFVGP
jgi:hypothetical protein